MSVMNQENQPKQVELGTQVSGRDRLARYVVVGSFLTIFLLCSVMVALRDDKDTAIIAKDAFNVILPVLAGWVGTVLAFYFSSANSVVVQFEI